jgi:hypothetical protein
LDTLDPTALAALEQCRLAAGELVTPPDVILADVNVDDLAALRPRDGVLDPGVELGLGLSGQGEACQVEIVSGLDGGSGPEGGHLAVAGVEQSGPSQEGPDAVDDGEVERVVGGVAGMDGAGEELAAGFGGGGHELQLGQVGAMVLAVAQLHEAVGDEGVEAATGGAIEPDSLDRQLVDLAGDAPEVGLDAVPEFGVTEGLEDEAEAVIGEVDVANGLSGDGFEGLAESVGPVADGALAVIGVGEDVGDPDGDEPALGESPMVRVGDEVVVEELGESELDEEPEEQGDVIDAFVSQLDGGGGIHGSAPTKPWAW